MSEQYSDDGHNFGEAGWRGAKKRFRKEPGC